MVGSLLSPFVRRVAIVLQFLEVKFLHTIESEAVGHTRKRSNDGYLDEPIFVRKDGRVLRESQANIKYARTLSNNVWRNTQIQHVHREKRGRIASLALFAMEQAVTLTNERREAAQDGPTAIYSGKAASLLRYLLILLDHELETLKWDSEKRLPEIHLLSCAVAWTYCQEAHYYLMAAKEVPHIDKVCQDAERLNAFAMAEYGTTPYPAIDPKALL